LGAAIAVAAGTALAVPTSMVHAIVGGLVGVTFFSRGWGAVSWDTVIGVALSWALSPALGGAFALLCRYSLKLAGASHARYKVAVPLISGVAACATVALTALSAPRWLLRRWFPTTYWALAGLLVLFAAMGSATAGFMHRNSGTSVANVAVYNFADEDEEGVDSPSRADRLGADDSLSSRRSLNPSDSAEVIVMDADLSGDPEDADLDIGDDDGWGGGAFVLDERAPIFQLLLAGTTAGIAFAHGSSDVALVMSPLAGILRALASLSTSSVATSSGGDTSIVVGATVAVRQASTETAEVASLHPAALVAAAVTIVAGLVLCSGRVIATMVGVNNRSKLSFARSFSVHLSTSLAVLATKCLGLPVSISYSIVASHAVSSVAYITSAERALDRVHEGLDVRLLSKMAVLAAVAPCFSALVAVCLRLMLGIIFT
jgi:phosphate/sulfate permease